MTEKPNEIGRKKGRLLRLLFQLVGVLVLVLFLVALAAKFWLIPAVVRARLLSLLTTVWQGPARVEQVKVDYSGPFQIKGLTLFDATGRRWLHIPTARLITTNWPGLKPVLTGIEVDQLKVQILLSDEEFDIPVKFAAPANNPSEHSTVDLRDVSIRDIAITIADPCGQTATLDNLTFSAVRSGSSYNLSLYQSVPKPTEALRLRGTVDPGTCQISLWMEIDHTLAAQETAVLFAALGIPSPVAAAGRVDGSLAISGHLKDPNALQTTGTVRLMDWIVKARDQVVAADLAAAVRSDGARCDFENITGVAYGGNIDGSFHFTPNPGGAPALGGEFRAQNIDFEKLTYALLGPERKAKGTLMFRYSFNEDTGEMQNLRGSGQLLLNDAELYVLPLAANIFRVLGVKDLTGSKMSDVHAAFRTTGYEVTLQSAHLANRLLAVQAEPGGKVNLQTGNLDLYLIGVPFMGIDALARQLPVVRLLVSFKDKLVRLRVRGHWSDPRDKLITKQPLKDVGEATFGFFADVFKEGGHLGRAALRKFGVPFDNPDAKGEN